MRILQRSVIWALLVAFSLIALGQLTVDATGPIRQRKRDTASGHGGGVGRRLPLQLAIATTGSPPDENGKTLVEFTLTNFGKKDLTVPISPHPGDLEPADPKAAYTVIRLGLRIGLSKKPGVIFPGGADLVGSTESPGTVVTLRPGDSVRVLARVALPEADGSGIEDAIDASATMDYETLKTMNGQLISDSQEIGGTISREYTMDSLLHPHD